MIKYILFIVLLFSSLHLYAQTITWQQSYELIPGAENDDESRGILVDSTGIYLVTRSYCGDNNNKPCVGIIKLEAESGDVIFKKNYTYIPPTDPLFAGNSRCLIKSLDNNFLLAGTLYLGNDQSTFIMKFDQNGDSLWFKTYQGEGLKLAQALIESLEGDLFFYSGGIGSQNNSLAGITKLDNEGNIIWTQQHDFTDVMFNPTGGCIALTEDQEILLYFSGYAIEPTDNSRYAHLAKFDQMGNLLWVDRLYREDFYYGQAAPKKYRDLPPLVAMQMLLQHQLPPYFQKVRHYGLHSAVSYQKIKDQIPDQLKRNGQTVRTVIQILKILLDTKPYECEHCGGTDFEIDPIQSDGTYLVRHILHKERGPPSGQADTTANLVMLYPKAMKPCTAMSKNNEIASKM